MTIILASGSKARRQILKNLGIKFRVMPSRVKEHLHPSLSARQTVRANALLKARDAASKVKKGIVVGCDTLVEQDGKIFGKPKDLEGARQMLKTLSSRPHRVYTGIAVIDALKHKEIVDVEETRILMRRLTEAQIKRYFKKVFCLDKAGGFDIQGSGGLFVRRIEGCFFNVVGLPLAKLYIMLKKMGVSLLAGIFCSALFGCATEFNVGTARQDRIMYSADQEAGMGDALAEQLEKNYILINDPELNERVRRVGEKITGVCDRREVLYRFRVIEDKKDKDVVNAVSLPGGYIYVFKNLLKVADNDDELAGVLGHEVGHIVAKHSIKRLQALWGYNIVSILSLGTRNSDFIQGTQLAYLQLLMGYSQEDELLADKLGARYARRAGFNPDALLVFLEKLRKREKKEEARPLSYFRTHPFVSERIKATKEELGEKISFEDFINTN